MSLKFKNMNYYELSFLTSNLTPEEKKNILKETEEIIKKFDGKVEEQFIEKKRFAYPVKKHNEGFLVIFSFHLLSENVEKIKKELHKNEKVLRSLIEKKKPPQKTKEKVETKPTEKPRKKKVTLEKLDEKLEEILK